jgi:hypothetical protein
MNKNIITRLREIPYCGVDHCIDEREEAAELLEAINALHQPNWHDNSNRQPMWCETCGLDWPCPTARLLHPEEADRG